MLCSCSTNVYEWLLTFIRRIYIGINHDQSVMTEELYPRPTWYTCSIKYWGYKDIRVIRIGISRILDYFVLGQKYDACHINTSSYAKLQGRETCTVGKLHDEYIGIDKKWWQWIEHNFAIISRRRQVTTKLLFVWACWSLTIWFTVESIVRSCPLLFAS